VVSKLRLDSFQGLSQALQGISRASERVATAASDIASGNIEAENMVEMKLAERDYQANAKSLKIQMDMEKDILDILA
jgi:flagellar hook protein FlgE